jgi:SSS family solute:Na+ symporter
LDGRKSDDIFPFFIINELPRGLTGLVIAAVLAAAMSSLSSSLNSVSAVGLVDIYRRHLAKGKDDIHYVLIAKLIGGAMGVAMVLGAAVLFYNQESNMLDISNVLTALTSGGLLGIYILGIFTKKGDDRSMMAAIFATVLFTGYMALLKFESGLGITVPKLPYVSDIENYYVGLIGHILLFVIAYSLASLLPKRDRDLHNLTLYTQDDVPLD